MASCHWHPSTRWKGMPIAPRACSALRKRCASRRRSRGSGRSRSPGGLSSSKGARRSPTRPSRRSARRAPSCPSRKPWPWPAFGSEPEAGAARLTRMLSRLVLVGLAAFVSMASAAAQEPGSGSAADPSARRQVRAVRINGPPPVVDGRLDEGVWGTALAAAGFVQKQPEEGAPALDDSEVRFLYDDRALYVGARMHKRDAT